MSDLQKTPNATPTQKMLDETVNFMELVEWLADGNGYKRFASEKAGCSVFSLFQWAKATPERVALVDEAQESIAESYVEMGERCLLDADVYDKETASASVSRAKALDNHYRWKASKHGRKYSDSLKLQGDKDQPLELRASIEKIERVIIDPKHVDT